MTAARLRTAREELVEAGPPAGTSWCRAWTDEVDAALKGLYASWAVRGRVALVAVGGYGRRELCPGSDVDLLLLVDRVEHESVAELARTLLHPLWDAGLRVGHAVREQGEAVAAARDLEALCALLDGRLVAGDVELLRSVRGEVFRGLRRRARRFLGQLAAADRARRERHGDAAEVLEPDVKQGAGGLRDVQSLRWAAGALLGETGLDPLVASSYLGAADRSRVARAHDLLLAVRVALHLETGSVGNVLGFDLHAPVARRLGRTDGHGQGDPDALLREVFLAARTVDHAHARAWRLLDADARSGRRRRRPAQQEVAGFGLVDGVLRGGAVDLGDADGPTRLLAALAGTGSVLDRETAAGLGRQLGAREGPIGWTRAARERFLEVLWLGSDALPALAEIDDAGLLAALLPEWGALRGAPQRNPYHRYSLDRHALHAAAGLGDLLRSPAGAPARSISQVEDREGLMLGTLLHDVGKAHGAPHAETGVPVARALCEHLGCDARTTDLVGRLVRLHLLLPETATRRDTSDRDLLALLAQEVGDRETLACLHLLAYADGRATGPGAWSEWKAGLVDELVERLGAIIDGEEGRPREVAAGEAEEVAAGLGVDPDVVRAHVARMPDRYATTVPARVMVRHAAVALVPPGDGEVFTRVTPSDGAGDDVDELDLVARDHPGLFARVAGVLAIHGGSVLSAVAFARADGLAVDRFVVRRPAAATASWWAAVEGDLAEAVAGRLAIAARVGRRARARRRVAAPTSTRVDVIDDPAGRATIIEVRTADAVGVLYRIVAALAELELDVVAAKVDTVGDEVVDVFYVRDSGGHPLDRDHAEEVVLAATAALSA